MGTFIDLTGQRFGKITVIERAPDFGSGRSRQTMWLCKCDCGKIISVRSHALRGGHTQSCGCLVAENHQVIHGLSHSRICRIFRAMKQRCYNPKANAYKDYGGRGITICDAWLDSFPAFYEWASTHGYQDNLSIDRIDVNGPYSPENCRWVNQQTQCANKRETIRLEHNGEIHTIEEWAAITGLAAGTIRTRIYTRKWDVDKALSTPISESMSIRNFQFAKGRVCRNIWLNKNLANKISSMFGNDVDKTSDFVESILLEYFDKH